jgi:hypothetical protein
MPISGDRSAVIGDDDQNSETHSFSSRDAKKEGNLGWNSIAKHGRPCRLPLKGRTDH